MEENDNFWKKLLLYLSTLDIVLGLPAKIGIFLTFLGGLIVAALGLFVDHPMLLQLIIATVLTILIGIPTIYMIRSTGYPLGYDAGYIYVYREAVYKFLPQTNRRTLQFGQTIEIRALKDGLTHWTGRYLWGAYGNVQIISKTKGFNVELPKGESSDEYDFYQIRFPSTLKRGQSVKFSTVTNLTVTSGNVETRLVTLIIVATIESVMRVILPPDDPPKEVKIHYYAHKNDDNPTWMKDGYFDEYTGEIEFRLPKSPKIGERYGIFWEFSNNNSTTGRRITNSKKLNRKSSKTNFKKSS